MKISAKKLQELDEQLARRNLVNLNAGLATKRCKADQDGGGKKWFGKAIHLFALSSSIQFICKGRISGKLNL